MNGRGFLNLAGSINLRGRKRSAVPGAPGQLGPRAADFVLRMQPAFVSGIRLVDADADPIGD